MAGKELVTGLSYGQNNSATRGDTGKIMGSIEAGKALGPMQVPQGKSGQAVRQAVAAPRAGAAEGFSVPAHGQSVAASQVASGAEVAAVLAALTPPPVETTLLPRAPAGPGAGAQGGGLDPVPPGVAAPLPGSAQAQYKEAISAIGDTPERVAAPLRESGL